MVVGRTKIESWNKIKKAITLGEALAPLRIRV